jgi:hypothetical protein
LKAFLEHFAAILGAATAALLAMSWTHEYGYFSTIGRQFQTFLATADYIANGALWLPLAFFFIQQTVQWSSLAVEPTEKGPKLKGWKNVGVWIIWLLWVVFIISTVTWPIDYSQAVAIMGFIVLFWSSHWRKFYSKVSLEEESFQLIVRELIRLGPIILAAMYIYGSVNAADDLTRTDNVYLFKFKDEKLQPHLYIFLRNFDRGVLARDAVEKRILFLKWDDLKEVSSTTPEKTNSLGCWLVGFMCSDRHKAIKSLQEP